MENACLVLVSEGSHDGSILLEDVKVCDICGDAGREDMLATCSRCTDGAEHIYCMRTMLEKLPDGDWICEDCVLSEEKEKRGQTKFSNFVASPKCNINETDQEVETSGASKLKVTPVSDSEGLGTDETRREHLNCLPSSERPLGNPQSALLTSRRALGLNNILTSRQYSKAPKSQDLALKSNQESSLPKNHSGRSMRENADLVTLSGQNFPKSHQLLTLSGLLTKSKSFNGPDRRSKVQLLGEKPEKQMLHSETAISTKGKACAVRSLKKSLSLSDARAGRSNALGVETKTSTPKLYEVSDLKRLRRVKECSSAEMEVKSVLKKPRIISADGSFTSASSGTGGADEVKKLSTKPNPSQELKHKGEVTSSSSLTSRRHLSGSGATGQDKLPARKRPSYQNLKAPQSSDSRLKDGCMYDESESALCHKFETVDSATNCHLEDSSAVSVIDMGKEEVLNNSCGRDLASQLRYQLNINGSLAVPMFDYIWKGEFEIHSRGRLPGILHRIQAHLSTQSSPKIPEVVKKFSDKILLEEVSRLTTWPTQFLKYQPHDDSIGLYFFAEDIESYSKYKSFLQCMIDYDLALKGIVDGIELLIFSSNLLPEKSQRWNKLLFLWGIFKQTKFIST